MKNASTTYLFYTIIGFILLLFSISIMPLRMESLLAKRVDLIQNKETEEAEAEVLSMEHGLSQEQMNDLNAEVNQVNAEINQLINHSAAVNDSINELISRAASEPHLLDTIQDLYNSEIMVDERKIDSLNQCFAEKSNMLMVQIRSFNRKERDLTIVQAHIRGVDAKLGHLSVLLPVHVGILALTLLFGLLFFILGLKNLKAGHQQ